ncbi:hypothetical protein HPP92_011916 [Vanilla planifolia]|uniref:Uncharacterized protein n=1 Tax=Vanilla planifolia TaxID=51239 RepID=A0A835V392_VANPL|nr:hypothetical protein HPP92_011916 [Vanilla planifolia]
MEQIKDGKNKFESSARKKGSHLPERAAECGSDDAWSVNDNFGGATRCCSSRQRVGIVILIFLPITTQSEEHDKSRRKATTPSTRY